MSRHASAALPRSCCFKQISLPVKKPPLASQPTTRSVGSRTLRNVIEGRDDVGRTDLGFLQHDVVLAQAALDRVVGADRNGRRVGAQILGNDKA